MNRIKGLSPLVATVLLVSITIVVAAIVASFANIYVRGETEKIQKISEDERKCDFANMLVHENLKSYDEATNNITIGVTNTGSDTLSGFKFIPKYLNGSFGPETDATPATLEPNEFAVVHAPFGERPAEVIIRTSCSNVILSVEF